MRLVVLTSLLVASLPAIAQQTPPAPSAAPTPAPAKPKLICRTEDTTGSRVGGHKVCLTADQWRQQQQESRDAADQVQRTPHG